MNTGIVNVGRRAYAVGLYWENSPSGRVAQAAKEAARQPGQQADFYAVRPGNKEGRVPQFALSQTGSSYKAGMPSFVACLANQQPGSWAGAFKTKEGTVIAIVRDELILPDGDLLYQNEAEARDRLLQEIGFGGLQKIYAPETWAIPGSDTMPITLLMNEAHDVTLRPVAIPKNVLIIGAVAVLLFLIGIGVLWYVQEEEARRDREALTQQEAKRRIEEAAKNLVPKAIMPKKVEYPPPERFWEEKPMPLAYVESCREGLSKLPVAVAGWRMGEIRCEGESLVSNWNRQSGFSAPPPGAIVDKSASNGVINIPLAKLSPREAENLVDAEDVTKRYLSQNWPGTLNAAPDDPLPSPPAGYQGPWNPPPAPWVKRSFTLTVRELPSVLPAYWSDMPGIIVNTLKYSPASTGGTWTIEGVIYENRPSQ